MKRSLMKYAAMGALWVCVTLAGCTFPGYVPPGPASSNVPSSGAATLTVTAVGQVIVDQAAMLTPDQGTRFCDRAAPGHPLDVTVADGTIFQPGEKFTKTWRLKNVGGCIWSEDYAIVWFSGELLGSSRILYLDAPVHPGETIDLTVEMTAPGKNGDYQSNWKLRNAEGELFGLGPQGDAPFWARVQVYDGATPTEPVKPTTTPTPIVYREGKVILDDSVNLDVESGSLDSGEDDDLSLLVGVDEISIEPLGSVKLGEPSSDQGGKPSQSECVQTELSTQAIVWDDLTTDKYICYQSSQGLPGYLWLKAADIDVEDGRPEAAFVTWFVP